MSRLELPLIGKKVAATGDVLLRAELDLLLRTHGNTLEQQTFRFDSATEMTTMPAVLARQLDLPMPQFAVPGIVHAQTGLEIRAGFLRAQIVGLDQSEYAFPCYFLGDPAAPPARGPSATAPKNLLGLTGVVDKIRISLDGTPTGTAPHGVMVIEKK